MVELNPFTPAFGTTPPIVVGRERILRDMRRAFISGPGNPNLSTILIGARGTGKTVCMSCIAQEAMQEGWVCVRTSAKAGMLQDIYEQTLRVASEHLPQDGAHVTSLSVGPVSASWRTPSTPTGNWRTRMSDVLDALALRSTGLLMTVDEVRADVDEMIELASVFQLFVVEQRKVALVMAGLPYHVHQLLNDESVSFLRRSMQHQLGRVSDADTRRAISKTFEQGGKSIDADALDLCTAAIEGFPYMLQLVGYRTWDETDGDTVVLADAERGIRAAKEDMEQHIYQSTYRDLSDGDVAFLEAMLDDRNESRLADISRRMGVKSNYSTKYKSRLLAQGVIGERGRSNVLGFDIPGFREYLARRRGDRRRQ